MTNDKTMARVEQTVAIGDEREALAKAIKVTEYKYFGDYEFSEGQHEAVETLVAFARKALSHPAPTWRPNDDR